MNHKCSQTQFKAKGFDAEMLCEVPREDTWWCYPLCSGCSQPLQLLSCKTSYNVLLTKQMLNTIFAFEAFMLKQKFHLDLFHLAKIGTDVGLS